MQFLVEPSIAITGRTLVSVIKHIFEIQLSTPPHHPKTPPPQWRYMVNFIVDLTRSVLMTVVAACCDVFMKAPSAQVITFWSGDLKNNWR